MATRFASVEDYLDSLDPAVRERVEQVRAAMLGAVGEGADDKVSYNIALVTKDGRGVLYYAGWAKHVAIYPTPHDTPFEAELAPLRAAKDSLHLKHTLPLPLDLLARLTAHVATTLD